MAQQGRHGQHGDSLDGTREWRWTQSLKQESQTINQFHRFRPLPTTGNLDHLLDHLGVGVVTISFPVEYHLTMTKHSCSSQKAQSWPAECPCPVNTCILTFHQITACAALGVPSAQGMTIISKCRQAKLNGLLHSGVRDFLWGLDTREWKEQKAWRPDPQSRKLGSQERHRCT